MTPTPQVEGTVEVTEYEGGIYMNVALSGLETPSGTMGGARRRGRRVVSVRRRCSWRGSGRPWRSRILDARRGKQHRPDACRGRPHFLDTRLQRLRDGSASKRAGFLDVASPAGIHIHAGESCLDNDYVYGHYFNGEPNSGETCDARAGAVPTGIVVGPSSRR